jgi:RNA polymerase primary sigma factor
MKIEAKKTTQATIERKLARVKLSDAQKNTLAEILPEPIGYIPHDDFRRPTVMDPIMAQNIKVIPGNTPTTEEERTLFQQLNFARFRMCQIRRKLHRQTRWSRKTLLELLDWYNHQLEYRSKIITANMGLVLAMAKRSDFPGVEFTDLVSEGSMALLRAAEKFDFARGFKFSTYACRAIFKGFSRTAKQNYRYRSRFPAQWDVAFEKDDYQETLREENHYDWVDEVRDIFRENLADLSGIEQSVVEMRFSLNEAQHGPLTLKQVGDKLGLTKERIRQIQNKALAKLRVTAQERMVTI